MQPLSSRQELRQAFRRIERELPPWLAAGLRWLRHPMSRLVRIPAGIGLIAGGIFSFLPLLGAWMLPLGLLLLAADFPILQKADGALRAVVPRPARSPSLPAEARLRAPTRRSARRGGRSLAQGSLLPKSCDTASSSDVITIMIVEIAAMVGSI